MTAERDQSAVVRETTCYRCSQCGSEHWPITREVVENGRLIDRPDGSTVAAYETKSSPRSVETKRAACAACGHVVFLDRVDQ